MNPGDYALLDQFRGLFSGKPYLHRDSSQGDKVVRFLYEDLRKLNRSMLLSARIDDKTHVVNKANKTVGRRARRGDGAFGERVHVAPAVLEAGFLVACGPISAIEIGAETKILAKAMIKQIDRVIGDLTRQAEEFKQQDRPICVAIVGVNHAVAYRSFEGTRSFSTDGSSSFKHPAQEAVAAIQRLETFAKPEFDEMII
jgi:hypothetical protein